MHLCKVRPLILAFVALLVLVTVQLFVAAPVAAQTLGDADWTGSMGGTLQDDGFGLAVDAAGNAIAVGAFRGSADFDPGPGTRILTSAGSSDAFITKLAPDGGLVWAVSVSGSESIVANDVALDDAGNIYVIGSFQGEADFDPGVGQRLITSNGSTDIFLLRLDPNGNLVRVITLGSDESDDGQAVDVDRRGHMYITGNFEDRMDVGEDPNGGFITLESEGEDDVFVIRYDNGGALLRAWTLSGDDDAIGRDIVVDDSGNVYVAGEFEGKLDFDPDLDDIRESKGDEDVFVAKYNDAADQKWAATFGGLEEDERPAISIDRAGNVYMTGSFESTALFETGATSVSLSSNGEEDIFLARLNSSGVLELVFNVGGVGSDRGYGIATGQSGDLFIVGSFQATMDFDPGPGQANLSSAGDEDVFVVRYAQNGYFYAAQALRGPLEDVGHAVALDAGDGLVVTGSYQGSVDFNAGGAAQVRTSAGDNDVFVTKRSVPLNPFGSPSAWLPNTNLRATFLSAP